MKVWAITSRARLRTVRREHTSLVHPDAPLLFGTAALSSGHQPAPRVSWDRLQGRVGEQAAWLRQVVARNRTSVVRDLHRGRHRILAPAPA
jgi:hypothetical protein